MIMSFKMAIRSISGNKMRAILTMLGIIIGVMALVVLVSLVNGATNSITSAVNDLGNSQVTVSISDDKGKEIRIKDINEWMDDENLGNIAPYSSETFVAKGDEGSINLTTYGTTTAYYDIQSLNLKMGRWLKNADVENSSYVCVLDEDAAENLVGYIDCINEAVTINGVKFTVVGVLSGDDESFIMSMMKTIISMDGMAYIPSTTLSLISDSKTDDITSFYIGVKEGKTVADAEARITDILMERFNDDEDAFSVTSQNLLEETLNKVTSVLEILLGGIAAISLIVGGIGIMNIMLVTVTERTREIGIRKAIGASRGSILIQFLMESVVLCMMGCALGIFISWSILQILSSIVASINMKFTLDLNIVLVSVIFCFVIGVIFGLYPANKAAKMKPIDALHYGG